MPNLTRIFSPRIARRQNQAAPNASAQARGNFSGRRVAQGQVPPQRRNLLSRLFASSPASVSASRTAPARLLVPHHPPAGKSGQEDGRGLAAQLLRPGLKPAELLNMVRVSAVIARPGRRPVGNYQDGFANSFQNAARDMSDLQLRLACNRADGAGMRNLTAALREAAEQAGPSPTEQAKAAELRALADNLGFCAATLRAEASTRLGGGQYLPPTMPQDAQAAAQARSQAHMVGQSLMQGVTASRGDFSPSLRATLSADQAHLTQTAEEAALPRDPNNPALGKLAGPEIFFRDFHRQTVHLAEGGTLLEKHRAAHPDFLSKSNKDPEGDISKTMIDYCGGNANQARRLTRVMNQEAIFTPYNAAIRGEFARSPYAGHDIGALTPDAKHAFHLTRAENGDIHVKFNQWLNCPAVLTQQGDMLPLDDRKSWITMEINFTLPAKENAPPELGVCKHESHLTAGQTAILGGVNLPEGLTIPGEIHLPLHPSEPDG